MSFERLLLHRSRRLQDADTKFSRLVCTLLTPLLSVLQMDVDEDEGGKSRAGRTARSARMARTARSEWAHSGVFSSDDEAAPMADARSRKGSVRAAGPSGRGAASQRGSGQVWQLLGPHFSERLCKHRNTLAIFDSTGTVLYCAMVCPGGTCEVKQASDEPVAN